MYIISFSIIMSERLALLILALVPVCDMFDDNMMLEEQMKLYQQQDLLALVVSLHRNDHIMFHTECI